MTIHTSHMKLTIDLETEAFLSLQEAQELQSEAIAKGMTPDQFALSLMREGMKIFRDNKHITDNDRDNH
jgi:hypothetical protein